ncbi:hypothetical protein ATCC90586_008500 [Pythium insidiosum]|nr:hypothetical protein ATCC90586_008500 [Pythium insidiosum]
MAAPRAGPLPAKSDVIGEIAFRRGERSKNPRKGEKRQIRFTPEGTGVHVRDDNTTRQAQALDEMIRDAEQPHPEDNDTAIIDVEIGAAWVKLRVRVSSPHAALRLPQHDIFSRGIFHGFTPTAPTPVLPGMRDQDHAGSDEDEDMVI